MPFESLESSEETGVDLLLSKTNGIEDGIVKEILSILEKKYGEINKLENIQYLGENLFFVSKIKEEIHNPIDCLETDMSAPHGKFLLLDSEGELNEIFNEIGIVGAKFIEGTDNDLKKYILTFHKYDENYYEGFLKYKEGKITQFISNISKSIPNDKEKIISELLSGNPVYIQFKNGEKHLVLMKNGETYYLNLEKYFPNDELGENITKKIQIKDNGVYILKNNFDIKHDIIFSNGIKGLIKIIINGKNITIKESLKELGKYYDLAEFKKLGEFEVLGKRKIKEIVNKYLEILNLN